MAPSDNQKAMIGMAFIVGAFIFMNMGEKEKEEHVLVQHDPPYWGEGPPVE